MKMGVHLIADRISVRDAREKSPDRAGLLLDNSRKQPTAL